MDIKVNHSNLTIPGNNQETLVQKARKFQESGGGIDDNEMLELVYDAEQDGINQDEEQFLAAIMDKDVAKKQLGAAISEPTTLSFTVDPEKQTANQLKVHGLKNKVINQPDQAAAAIQANRAAAAGRKDAELAAKTAKGTDVVDKDVQTHGIVKDKDGKLLHSYSHGADQKLKPKYNATAGVGATDEHCCSFVAHAYKSQGFKHPQSLGSTEKSVAYFVYKDSTAHPGKGFNPEFEKAKKDDAAAGTGRKLMLLDGDGGKEMKTHMKSKHPDFDAGKNTYDWSKLPIQKGDMILMKGQNSAYGEVPGHGAMVKGYDAKTGLLTVTQANPMKEYVLDLKDPVVRKDIMGFGRPSPNDFK